VTKPLHAPFLSYASQDQEAAQRTRGALRAAGIEIRLDQSALRGGDVWDRTIRKQITTCGAFIPVVSTAMILLFGTTVQAQTPTPEDNARDSGEQAQAARCRLYGCGNSGPSVSYDPCYLAQNAMRPCVPSQSQQSKTVGVDPHIVGIWKLALENGSWVLEIRRDGTYRFHSEGQNGAQPHDGTFSASKGHWSLTAKNGYTDGGTYQLHGDTWIATGRLGTGTWHRDATTTASSKR
jgi:hypothetical protein